MSVSRGLDRLEYYTALEFLKRANLIDSIIILNLCTLKTHANQYYILVIDTIDTIDRCIRKSFKLDFKVANELKKMGWMGVQTCS